MKMAIGKYVVLLAVSFGLVFTGCKKYLAANSNISNQVPTTAGDLQALLNRFLFDSPTPIIASDDYFLQYSGWSSMYSIFDQMNYLWDANTPDEGSWAVAYNYIENYNTVLDNINNVSLGDSSAGALPRIKARALFLRAYTFLNLVQVYTKGYDICLRTTSSATASSIRATMEETYNQIINDFKTAAVSLPVTEQFSTTPTKVAAYGALARVYLSMSDFVNAKAYADSCLTYNSNLIDFNTLDSNSRYSSPTPQLNPEIIFYTEINGSEVLKSSRALVDSNLYSSYDFNDLRRPMYFRSSSLGGFTFNGSYSHEQSANVFDGIAVDEIYLIRAECEARTSEGYLSGMDDLNTLLKTRWLNTVPFPTFSATSADDALMQILIERRKELLFRGQRKSDLERNNLEPQYAVTLSRDLNGVVYSLPANDLRYAYLIPENVIALGGIVQNPR